MSKKCFVLLLLLLMGSALYGQTDCLPCAFSVQGTITDLVTSEPLAGCVVMVTGGYSLTDGAGYYYAGDWPTCTATNVIDVVVSKTGYHTVQDTLTIGCGVIELDIPLIPVNPETEILYPDGVEKKKAFLNVGNGGGVSQYSLKNRWVQKKLLDMGFDVTTGWLYTQGNEEYYKQFDFIAASTGVFHHYNQALKTLGIPVLVTTPGDFKLLGLGTEQVDAQGGEETVSSIEFLHGSLFPYPMTGAVVYEEVPLSTEPVSLYWVPGELLFGTPFANIPGDRSKVTAAYATSPYGINGAFMLPDNPGSMTEIGWYPFEVLVNWMVPRVEVVSETKVFSVTDPDPLVIQVENRGIPCNWQLFTPGYEWLMPLETSGSLGVGETALIGLDIDWMEYDFYEPRVKDDLYLIFTSPGSKGEIQYTRFTVTASWFGGVIKGDANGDGVVDIVDALLVARFAAGFPASVVTEAADVNDDGAIDIVDALIIAKQAADLQPVF